MSGEPLSFIEAALIIGSIIGGIFFVLNRAREKTHEDKEEDK